MAENKQTDCVSFKEVLKSYAPGEALCVQYELQEDYVPASRDWVGLFQVGWTSSRDYYTFEWAPTPEANKGTVKFAGRRLPPEDSHFYQFCYVSSNGRVRGASPPFQFSSASISKHNVDDLELVEVNEDSLMVLQAKTAGHQEAEMQRQMSSVMESLGTLELEKKTLNEQIVAMQTEGLQCNKALREKETTIATLQRELEAKTESEKRLIEKLEIQRQETNQLLAVKHDEDAQIALLTSQLAGKEDEISQQNTTIMTVTAEIRELKEKLQIKDSNLEDLTRLVEARAQEKEQLNIELERITDELLDNKGKIADLMDQNEQKVIEFEQVNVNFEDIKSELDCSEKRCSELQQELDIAQQNISELMGHEQTGEVLVIERPTMLPEPPTAPAAPAGTVDSSVYAALNEAFDNVQKYYEDVKKDNVTLQIKADEMMARVEECKSRYEVLANENVELKKKIKSDAAQINELEEQLDDITQGCGTAVTELTTRKEENKSKDAKISFLEENLAQTQNELTTFQDRYDREMQRRTEACDIQKAALDSKIGELQVAQGKIVMLQQTNDQLKQQLEALKSTPKPDSNRTCPVCSTKFPARMRQQDFENHVQGHFRQ